MTELSQEALAIIEKVQKLLKLAGNNPNEHEAASASAKAMELLAAYNLDMMVVERHSGKTGKREDTKLAGGLYKWQRELWSEVAKLHFCMYWSIRGLHKGSTYEHRVLGRHENVVGTRVMAEYLQQTVERLAREWAGDPKSFFTKSAISYREGMAVRLASRLRVLREAQIAEDQKKSEWRSRHPKAPGTALVLADVISVEHDANMDHLYGEGWSARRKAAAAAADVEYAKQEAARKKWELENPEEHARQQAEAAERSAAYWKKEEKLAKRRKPAVYRGKAYKGDADAYWEGHAKGADIGLDRQIDKSTTERLK